MAVLCPMYDSYCGWYIIDQNGNKKLISSLLYYYYSLGVNPPVGAKITQNDIEDFKDDLYAESDNDNYDDLDYTSTYSTNFLSNLLNSSPSVQFQPESTTEPASLTENFKQIPSTSSNSSYVTGPVDPSNPFSVYQPLSNNMANQTVPMTGPNSSSSILTAMFPFLPLTSEMSLSKKMEPIDDEEEDDEFDEEDSFTNDCFSPQSP